MSEVATFDAGQPLTVTPEAARHLHHQLARHDGAIGARIAVKPSGCSGYMYVLEPVTEAPGDARRMELDDGLVLFIDESSMPVIAGTTLRFERVGINEQIQFDNPRASGHCGCGESFTVDSAALQ